MKVRFFATIREYTGCAESDVPFHKTIGDLARSLCELYGEKLRQKIFPPETDSDKNSGAKNELKFGPEIIILINGRHVNHLGGPAAVLSPDDRVDIFPVVAGG